MVFCYITNVNSHSVHNPIFKYTHYFATPQYHKTVFANVAKFIKKILKIDCAYYILNTLGDNMPLFSKLKKFNGTKTETNKIDTSKFINDPTKLYFGILLAVDKIDYTYFET